MKSTKFTSLADYRASLKTQSPKPKGKQKSYSVETLGTIAATEAVNKALAKLKRKR